MAEHKSDQITNSDATPKVMNKSNISGGRVRRQGFTFTVPTGGVAIADTIQFCKVPSGARFMGGELQHDDVGAATATLAIGDGTTAAKYAAAEVVDAAGGITFGKTLALGFMDELSGELTLTGTVAVAALTAGKVIKGYVEFMAD